VVPFQLVPEVQYVLGSQHRVTPAAWHVGRHGGFGGTKAHASVALILAVSQRPLYRKSAYSETHSRTISRLWVRREESAQSCVWRACGHAPAKWRRRLTGSICRAEEVRRCRVPFFPKHVWRILCWKTETDTTQRCLLGDVCREICVEEDDGRQR